MNTTDRIAGMSLAELNRLHDEALQRVDTLRDEAIDEFWRGANAALWARLCAAQHAAERLSQRLRRHRQLRALTSPSS